MNDMTKTREPIEAQTYTEELKKVYDECNKKINKLILASTILIGILAVTIVNLRNDKISAEKERDTARNVAYNNREWKNRYNSLKRDYDYVKRQSRHHTENVLDFDDISSYNILVVTEKGTSDKNGKIVTFLKNIKHNLIDNKREVKNIYNKSKNSSDAEIKNAISQILKISHDVDAHKTTITNFSNKYAANNDKLKSLLSGNR